MLHYSTTPGDCRKREAALKPPEAVAQSRALRALILYLEALPSLWGAATVRKRQDQLALVLFTLLWILGIYLGTRRDGGGR